MSRNFTQSDKKEKWGDCLSCRRLRYIVSRGICMGCWKTPDIRERFKDKRLVPRNPISPEHHLILANEGLTEPKKLYFLAWRKARRWGVRVEISDLVQIGWLVMMKCVKDYDTAWETTLFRFCKRGISSEMERHCMNELRSSTMGASHEDFVDFIANDHIDRLSGGTQRFQLGHTFNVTDHALERYRERFNPTGTRKQLKKYVETSKRLPPEREELWLRTSKGASSACHEARESGDMILIMGPATHLFSKQQQLITVMRKDVA